MVIDFSTVDLKERPVLVLRNADGTAIQTLGYAYGINMNLRYNETSSITFELPAYVDGEKTPHYDDVIGMRIVDVKGWGQFILVDPSVEKSGIKEVKSCKAYSLEYELTYKKISITEDNYNFWDKVAPDNTVLDIIMSYLPSWSVGKVDPVLEGKYRTFSEDNQNLYNFVKSTLQTTYNCIFDFDTYKRTISVRSVETEPVTEPVYLSLNNLAKSINVSEDTESIITRLDVSGAEGVDIRGVNPMGSNKLYNLDYFMNTTHFSQSMVDKWDAWKQSFESNQLAYYNTSVERALKTSAILTEQAALAAVDGTDMAQLENLQSVYIEYLASLTDTTSDEYLEYQKNLNDVNLRIAQKQGDIDAQDALIATLEAEKDALTQELLLIQSNVAFSKFFEPDEIVILDRYFKEDSIEESSFVVSNVESYSGTGESDTVANLALVFNGGEVTKILGVTGKELYSVHGGTIVCAQSDEVLSANVISGSFERMTDGGSFVLSAYLGSGTLNVAEFPKGCISLTGICDGVTGNTVPDADAPGAYETGSSLSCSITSAKLYFTMNTTEYERYSVEWDLYEYGRDCLRKLAQPSFSFSVSTANFFALDEFVNFADHLALGRKIYLDMDEGDVLQPILIGVDLDFDDLSSLNLLFGDKYTASDSVFQLVDLLDQSISMGKTVDTSKLNYNSFIDSGASTAVKQFMESSLDVSKNAIMSSDDMAISWGSGGIRCRKAREGGGYEDEQIAIINNNICFTDDGWKTAKMAIGKFSDSETGESWGVVAPNIVGTLIAGQNLVIESEKQDGGVSVFRVDSDGAVLHNARFDLVNETNTTHIMLDPALGLGIGTYPVVSTTEGVESWDETNAKFWVDTDGNIHFKGNLEGCTGSFTGELKVGGDTGLRVDSQGNLSIGGTAINPNFYVSATGDLKALSINGRPVLTDDDKISSAFLDLGKIILDGDTGTITLDGDIKITGNIEWSSSNSPVQVQYSSSTSGPWHTTMVSGDKYAQYSYDGGVTWTSAVQIVGTNGSNGRDGIVDAASVFNVLTGNGTRFGVFSDESGHLVINANYIKSGVIDAGLVTLSTSGTGTTGGFTCARGLSGSGDITYGAKMYGGGDINGYPYIIVTDAGWRLQGNANYYLYGTTGGMIAAHREISVTSDRRAKNSITYDMDRYEEFFFGLKPTSYKLNSDEQNERHLGFVAQDVEQSLLTAGLNMEDFAGVIHTNLDEENEFGRTDEYLLCYSEFISLNTHMIQKLYRKVEELERRLYELGAE